MAPEFKENLVGRLSNFPLSVEKPLYPVFEAISNSIHAIEDAKNSNGEIEIELKRDRPDTAPMGQEIRSLGKIIGFVIRDNGIGFTQQNFTSFCIADSTFKRSIGGKGVGRLSWLKVFQQANINSKFLDANIPTNRSFSFTLGDNPITSHCTKQLDRRDTDFQTGTIIEFQGFKPDYQKNCPKNAETIAKQIIDHFLILFVTATCPRITVIDSADSSTIPLNKKFDQLIGRHSEEQSVYINSEEFRIQHFRMPTRSSQPDHSLHFCAMNRSVEKRDLGTILPNLRNNLVDDKIGSFAYAGYISGASLDKSVNQERTRLDLLHSEGILQSDEPTKEDILTTVAKCAEKFLDPYLEPIRANKISRIAQYIQKRPRFKPLLKLRSEWLDQIKPDLSDEDLEIELYKLMHQLEIEVRKSGAELRSKQATKTLNSLSDHKDQFKTYLEESNQVGFSKLAEYVIHRRAVIDFLDECMKLDEHNKYQLEETIHDVIYPIKNTSGSTPDPDQSNLWMIDERLSYHYYLSSDIEFKGTEELRVKEKHERERVDLLVLQPYDRPHAFVGTTRHPFDCVTIIEFKRPMRNDSSSEDDSRNPITQVWNYARKIRDGHMKDKHGTFIRVAKETQFFAYIICNLSPSIEQLAELSNFTKMPDNLGYFNWQNNLNVYTEILDYEKVIQDAKKRNEVFFDKFNLPSAF